MEANMSLLKRRLNKAMLECRSQASFTARRLVGQMRNERHQNKRALPERHQRRTFRYSFSPTQEAQDHDDEAPASVAADQFCHNATLTNNGHLMDEQQVEEFLSEEESSINSSSATVSATNTTTSTPDVSHHQHHHQSEESNSSLINRRQPHKTLIKTQHFVRCSAMTSSTSRRRSSARRRRSGRQNRQVRFQPNPQSIDISSDSCDLEPQVPDGSMQQTVTAKQQAAVKRLRRAVHLPSAAKPFARRLHHLSHLKFADKIKLKSFNQLAQHLQQSLSPTAHSPTCGVHQVRLAQKVTSSPPQFSSSSVVATAAGKLKEDQDDNDDDDDGGWGSDFDEHSSQDSSLEHHAPADASKDYMLEIGKASSDQRAIEDVIQDCGISGQFKRLDQHPSPPEQVAAVAPTCGASANHLPPQPQASHINYKLRIELERRMIRDSLLAEAEPQRHAHSAVAIAPPESPPELEAAQETSEDDDEAELRSLEARQGFRQIRDKLKVILDQRLANYEQEAQHLPPAPAKEPVGGAVPQPRDRTSSVNRPHITINVPQPRPVDDADSKPATTDTSTTTTAATAATTTTVPHSAANEFDCQSHCSDESGLESNHSGSQDSGHSTQHSGYSGHSHCAMHRRHAPSVETEPGELSSAAQSPVGAQKAGSSGADSAVESAESCSSPERRPNRRSAADKATDVGVADMERRSRFLQNRLIINSKLESMFKSRAQVSSSSSGGSSSGSSPLVRSQTMVSLKAANADIGSHLLDIGSSMSHLAGADSSELRNRLLEQQRQMSLKLKQKPRRKSAKRALMNCEASQQQAAVTAGQVAPTPPPPPPPLLPPVQPQSQSTDNGSYASGSGSELSSRADSVASSNRCVPMIGRDNLAKQLSMICLRQAGQQQVMQQAAAKVSSSNHHHHHNQQQQQAEQPHLQAGSGPRAALSLRQLVKDVIDDCEKPNKLSPLTLSILNRSSDSLTSELAANMAAANAAPTCNSASTTDHHHRPLPNSSSSSHLATSGAGDPFSSVSSSLSSLPAQPASSSDIQQPQHHHHHQQQQQHLSYDHLSSLSQDSQQQQQPQATATESIFQEEFRQPIGYIYPVPLANPLQFQQPQHQQVVDQSLSSMGSIDGLEFSLGNNSSASNSDLSTGHHNHRKSTATQRLQKSTIGSYLKSLREFSRFKLPKVKLISGSAIDVHRNSEEQHSQAADSNNNNGNGNEVDDQNDVDAIYRRQLPFETQQRLLGNNGSGNNNNYNYEYHLDRVVGRQQQQQQQPHQHQQQQPQKPEASSTLAGTWRRRPKRMSIMEADSRAIAMMSSSPTTTITSSPSSSSQSSSSKGDGFANHFVTISNRKWKSCHLRTSLMQITAFRQNQQHQQPISGNHGNHHHHHQTNAGSNHSPVHTTKHQLAYLDNSRNFTDDDN